MNSELAGFLEYGIAEGNGSAAVRIYQERNPDRPRLSDPSGAGSFWLA